MTLPALALRAPSWRTIVSQTRQPRQELQAFVRAYGQREIDGDSGSVGLVPPRLEQTLEFQFGEPISYLHPTGVRQSSSPIMIAGASTHSGTLSLPGAVVSFGIFFQPTGFSRLFGIPMVETLDHAYEASAVLGNRLRLLQAQLAECSSFAQRVLTVETFLCNRAVRSSQSSPIDEVAAAIFAAKGAVRISDLACGYGVCLRQFERTFLTQTGMQPKLYARIARFQSALDAKIASPRRPWIDIAHCLGYHDEMHLAHDFNGLAGATPGRTVSSISDVRPPALLSLE